MGEETAAVDSLGADNAAAAHNIPEADDAAVVHDILKTGNAAASVGFSETGDAAAVATSSEVKALEAARSHPTYRRARPCAFPRCVPGCFTRLS